MKKTIFNIKFSFQHYLLIPSIQTKASGCWYVNLLAVSDYGISFSEYSAGDQKRYTCRKTILVKLHFVKDITQCNSNDAINFIQITIKLALRDPLREHMELHLIYFYVSILYNAYKWVPTCWYANRNAVHQKPIVIPG